MNKRDYYEVLGAPKNAPESELKKAYRKKAMEHHPDKNPGDSQSEELFKEAAEAYEVLRDPEKRRLYDQFGHEGLRQRGFSGFSGFEDIFSSFGDVFEDFFGFGGARRGRGPNQPAQGADLRYDMEITFMEAVHGVEKEFKVDKYAVCPKCDGERCAPGTSPETCSTCSGTGRVTKSQGFFAISTACPACMGEGIVITNPCKECKGAGQVVMSKKMSVKSPAGIDTGSRLRIRGEGEPGRNGGAAGDFYVVMHVEEHEYFHREGDDIYLAASITFSQAALGADIKIPALDGEIDFTVKAGTQPNAAHRISGAGVPHLRSYGNGDMIVQISIVTPEKLSKREEEIYRELAQLENKRVRPHQKGFFEKLMK